MDSLKINKDTDAKEWIKDIDFSSPNHLEFVCDYLEHINEWRDFDHYFVVNYDRYREFYFHNYCILLDSLANFGEIASKPFGKYLYDSWFFDDHWGGSYNKFKETKNYIFFFEIYTQDYRRRCLVYSSSDESMFIESSRTDSLTFLQMSPNSKDFLIKKLKSGDIYDKTKAAYFLTSCQDIDIIEPILSTLNEVPLNDDNLSCYFYTYIVMTISNLINSNLVLLDEDHIKSIKQFLKLISDKTMIEGRAELLGLDVPSEPIVAGEPVPVRLYLRTLGDMPDNEAWRVCLSDPLGEAAACVTQATPGWEADAILEHAVALDLLSESLPGEYSLRVSLWDTGAGREVAEFPIPESDARISVQLP